MVSKEAYENGLVCSGICCICTDKDQCYQYLSSHKLSCVAIQELVVEHEDNLKSNVDLSPKNTESLYTEEQYQRCLSAAKVMSNMIISLKKYPLTVELLSDLVKSGDNFEKVLVEVVNEKHAISNS